MAADGDDRTLRSTRWAPYLLAAPAIVCIYLFFVVPLVTLTKIALSDRAERGSSRVDFSWAFDNFSKAFTDFGDQLWRALLYALITTVLCIVLAYPLAYFIAFKAGRWRNLLLGLVMVPFFTSFLLRTIAWQSLFADNGPILAVIETLHMQGALDAIGVTTDGKITRRNVLAKGE